MGLPRGSVTFLLEEAKRRPFSGRVLTLGHQDVSLTWEELQELAGSRGFRLTHPGMIELNTKPELRDRGYISQRTLFKALGFERVESLDASEYEGSEHIADLNDPEPPRE